MGVEVALNTPLADALNDVIQPKLVEVGWSTGGVDDSALSEYIILMLVNGKTQDQIAAELSGDLLNLGPDDPDANDFSRWLFEQVDALDQKLNGRQKPPPPEPTSGRGTPSSLQDNAPDENMSQCRRSSAAGDTEMADSSDTRTEGQIPTEPKSMRNGNRNRRLMGQLSKAMDRSSDAVLHRVRAQQGTERINGHQREPPKGPRAAINRIQNPRPPVVRPPGVPGVVHPSPLVASSPGAAMMNMSPQQQMQLLAMYEEQARVMSQIFAPHPPQQMFAPQPFGAAPPGHGFGFLAPPPVAGRSLFERVEPRPAFQNGGHHAQQAHHARQPPKPAHPPSASSAERHTSNTNHAAEETHRPAAAPAVSSTDEASQEDANSDPATTTCKFNLACTKEDCPYAHQSPAAPPGTTIDVTDNCSFGAACKNRKCVARHPSPAKKMSHQAEQICRFFPNCANPACPFRHPTMPLCRNGADCTRPGCKFTHLQTACKFNPCLNMTCPYKHTDGQKRGAFEDKVWTAEGGEREERPHVSERKFVIDEAGGEEELILPTGSAPQVKAEAGVVA